MLQFMPGLQLCERFYHEVVSPLLDTRFPGLAHSAGRLDGGSEVLGFDTPQSMDHDWGPANFTLFLADADFASYGTPLLQALADHLPHEFHGFPTDLINPEASEGGSRVMYCVSQGPVAHRIAVTTVSRFFEGYLGFVPLAGLHEIDWLLIPQQRLRTVACGRIFHDGLHTLQPSLDAVRWYPRDVWLYLLACQWQRINQEEPFMARCGDVGDELGARLVAARLVNELMRLCFLLERQYWPYYKWFGTAFSRLDCAGELTPIFHAIFDSRDWKTREQHLTAAYLAVMRLHNALGLTDFIEPMVSPFFDRPYLVPHAARFVNALHARITSEAVSNLPKHVGAVAQFVDATDILDAVDSCKRLDVLYR